MNWIVGDKNDYCEANLDNYFVSDIVNTNDFTNREYQKILKANNLSINKISYCNSYYTIYYSKRIHTHHQFY